MHPIFRLDPIKNSLMDKENVKRQHDLIQNLMERVNGERKKILFDQLKYYGYEFKNEEEFIEFINKRLTVVSTVRRPNEQEVYLDFQSQKRIYMGIMYNPPRIDIEEGRHTITLGKFPKVNPSVRSQS